MNPSLCGVVCAGVALAIGPWQQDAAQKPEALVPLQVEVTGPRTLLITGDRATEFDLTELTDGATLREARVSRWLESGAVVALVVEIGEERHEYRYAAIRDLDAAPPTIRTSADGWYLTEPIFTSRGERYRIVEVHSPVGDTLEITFRRGLAGAGAQPGSPGGELDERVFVDVCPARTSGFMPLLQKGRSALYAVRAIEPVQ